MLQHGRYLMWSGVGFLLLLFLLWGTFTVSDGGTDPIPTSGLVLLLESDLNVATSGSVVSGWLDQSGNGNNLAAVGNPELVAGATPSGQPAIAFDGGSDGTGDKLERTATLNNLPDGSADRTLFLVVNYTSNGYGGFAYGDGACGATFGLIVDDEGALAVQRWCDDYITSMRGTEAGWLVQSAMLSGTTLTHYKDGALIATEEDTSFKTTLGRLVLGAEIDSAPYLDMDVAAVVVYDRALTETERQQVEQYLQGKYLDIGVPSSSVRP